VRRTLEPHLHRAVDVPLLERDLAALTGLDRYQSVTWRMTEENGRAGLLVSATEKSYAPPFLMLGLNIENTTSENFRVQLAARYLTFDLAGSGSELRVDAGLGADPNLSAALYKPFGGSHLFGRATGTIERHTFNFVQNDETIAEYGEVRQIGAFDLGTNLSRQSELSGGFWIGHVSDSVRAGDPGLPEVSGAEHGLRLRWVLDTQDSPIVPSRGFRVVSSLEQTLAAPEVTGTSRTNASLTQMDAQGSWFTSPGRKNRVFVVASAGTSFDDHPLPTKQFTVGYPYVLDAFPIGERRGDHYGVLTIGAMRQVSRLPDFIGGPVFIGGWLENGSVFNSTGDADFNTHIAVGLIMDTIVGPIMIASSSGLDGGWRTIFGIGRIVR
jgi:NTE family protein